MPPHTHTHTHTQFCDEELPTSFAIVRAKNGAIVSASIVGAGWDVRIRPFSWGVVVLGFSFFLFLFPSILPFYPSRFLAVYCQGMFYSVRCLGRVLRLWPRLLASSPVFLRSLTQLVSGFLISALLRSAYLRLSALRGFLPSGVCRPICFFTEAYQPFLFPSADGRFLFAVTCYVPRRRVRCALRCYASLVGHPLFGLDQNSAILDLFGEHYGASLFISGECDYVTPFPPL